MRRGTQILKHSLLVLLIFTLPFSFADWDNVQEGDYITIDATRVIVRESNNAGGAKCSGLGRTVKARVVKKTWPGFQLEIPKQYTNGQDCSGGWVHRKLVKKLPRKPSNYSGVAAAPAPARAAQEPIDVDPQVEPFEGNDAAVAEVPEKKAALPQGRDLEALANDKKPKVNNAKQAAPENEEGSGPEKSLQPVKRNETKGLRARLNQQNPSRVEKPKNESWGTKVWRKAKEAVSGGSTAETPIVNPHSPNENVLPPAPDKNEYFFKVKRNGVMGTSQLHSSNTKGEPGCEFEEGVRGIVLEESGSGNGNRAKVKISQADWDKYCGDNVDSAGAAGSNEIWIDYGWWGSGVKEFTDDGNKRKNFTPELDNLIRAHRSGKTEAEYCPTCGPQSGLGHMEELASVGKDVLELAKSQEPEGLSQDMICDKENPEGAYTTSAKSKDPTTDKVETTVACEVYKCPGFDGQTDAAGNDYRQMAMDAIAKVDGDDKDSQCLTNGNARISKEICPNIDVLQRKSDEMKKLWVFALNATAWEASRCDSSADDPGEFQKLEGLFDLPYARAVRDLNGMHPEHCKADVNKYPRGWNSKDLKFQFECAVSQLKKSHCGKGDVSSYWVEGRKASGKISQLISKYPGCKK